MNSAVSHQFLAYGPKVVVRDGRLFSLRGSEQRMGTAVVFDFVASVPSLDTLQFVVRPVPYSDLLEVEVRFYSESLSSTQVVRLGSLTPADLARL